MATKLIKDETLTDIANAIRYKNKGFDTYKPTEMAQAIEDISTAEEANATLMMRLLAEKHFPLADGTMPEKLTCEDVSNMLTTAFNNGVINIASYAFYGALKAGCGNTLTIPEGIQVLNQQVFYFCVGYKNLVLPTTLKTISTQCFSENRTLQKIYFQNPNPTSIAGYAFSDSTSITDIYVPWSEGEVKGAPWGAANAIVHYDYTFTGEEV